MVKRIQITELKAKKEGKITPKMVLENLLDHIERNPENILRVAIVAFDDDDRYVTANSSMKYGELISMHEIAKLIAYDEME